VGTGAHARPGGAKLRSALARDQLCAEVRELPHSSQKRRLEWATRGLSSRPEWRDLAFRARTATESGTKTEGPTPPFLNPGIRPLPPLQKNVKVGQPAALEVHVSPIYRISKYQMRAIEFLYRGFINVSGNVKASAEDSSKNALPTLVDW